jgi:hypothetical protein
MEKATNGILTIFSVSGMGRLLGLKVGEYRGLVGYQVRLNNLTMEKIRIDSPALLFGPKFETVEFIRNEELLSITDTLALKKGIVIGNFIVDSSGRTFQTIGARKKSNYHSFWKFEFFNPLIFIELQVKALEDEISLPELKEKIVTIIKLDRGHWINYGRIGDIIKSIHLSKTHRELIAVIGDYIEPLLKK